MNVPPLQMIQKTVTATKVINSSLVTLPQKCKTLTQLKEIHAYLLKSLLSENPYAIGPIISVAATSNDVASFTYATSIFRRLGHRNTFVYNSMIRGFMKRNLQESAVSCYLEMLGYGVMVNNYTFPPLIKACSILSVKLIGRLVHSHVIKFGLFTDPFVVSALIEFYGVVCHMEDALKVFDRSPVRDVVMWTGMIDGYGKAGDVEKARDIFEAMPERNAISWSAIMAAYSRISDFREVLTLFRRMQDVGTRPNESVLVTAITACAHLGAVTQGLWIHSYVKRSKLCSNVILATALVDMYSRFGHLDSAVTVFERIANKDSGAWNAMISGLALNGDVQKSLELFHSMISDGTQPNEITFVSLLSACTHAKMVREGLQLFAQMNVVHGVKPRHEHYACVVDLLARAGMVEEAEKFIDETMGGLGCWDANVWGSLLNACRIHGNVEVANRIWTKLANTGVTDSGAHVLSYNIFKEAGWEIDARRVRKMISEAQIQKQPGCSVIEVNGVAEGFLAGAICHPLKDEIYKMLDSVFKLVSMEKL